MTASIALLAIAASPEGGQTSLMPMVTRSSLVPDAHLAALAIEHGLVLCSTDGDFARFDGLRWLNPLI